MKKNPAGKVRAAAFILAITLALAAAAGCVAETEKWNLFDRIAEHIEGKVPESAARIMQRDLYTETVNNVEITVREAGYDGRTLFLQYGFRMLDVDVPLGVRARDVYGDELPEGTDPDSYVDGYLTEDAEELLYEHHVGWWIDGIWINGTELDDMPDGSGQYMTGTEVPGEIVETDFWRLDNVGVFPEGKIRISLPIGEMQDFMDYSRADHPEKFDENGNRKVPEKGMVTFEYDASDILSTLRVIRPERETSLPDVTVKVREIAFSPVMTYITLDLEVNPDAL